MKRREFIALLAGATVCNSTAWGQGTQHIRRIGVLQILGPDSLEYRRRLGALKEGLQDLGWVEGRNIAFELRSTVGKMERLSDLAAELGRNAVGIVRQNAGATDRVLQALVPVGAGR